ncbi:MAG: hypothetical protein ACJ77M_07125 [Thermoleophilaceae bacterium]
MDLIEYLREARGAELDAAERLAEAIGRTARADHRVHLESHLDQEREHATLLEARLRELHFSQGALGTLAGIAHGALGVGVGLVSAPLRLVRASASPAETLRNAEELAASEAHEVARYTALERLAKRSGDAKTARLARSIRRQEEDQLDLLRREIPRLADHVLGDDVAPAKPRPQRRQPRKRQARRRPAAETSSPSRRPRTHSATAGPDRAEAARIREAERDREGTGPGADLHVDEPWPGYASMSAADVAARVANEPEPVRAAVRLYEAANERRELVMRVTSDA